MLALAASQVNAIADTRLTTGRWAPSALRRGENIASSIYGSEDWGRRDQRGARRLSWKGPWKNCGHCRLHNPEERRSESFTRA